ncbi:MAG: lytic transglycosylase domain-containing protein [Candidatus Binatia bacterium]|nr:lytic transglycosylase domain-containing protein [Candidatus Binatia bacterium]
MAAVGVWALAAPAAEKTIHVPVELPPALVREALMAQLFTTATGKAVIWDDGSGCRFLKLREPVVDVHAARLRIRSRAEARVGTPIGEQCIAPIDWDGILEVHEEPLLSEDGRTVTFRVVDSALLDPNGKQPFFSNRIWALVKERAHPRFETVEVRLGQAVDELREVLPLYLPHREREAVDRMLASLRFQEVSIAATGLRAVLAFSVPLLEQPTPAPEPTLTPEELERWQQALDRWDAFLTYTVKFVWADSLIRELRQPLADVLLEGRYDLLEALAPGEPGAPDPVPGLFVRTWERLAPVLREIAVRQKGQEAIRYLSFISAGDALVALQEAGPGIGVDLSADGLRRLARILAPADVRDPLRFDTAVDPELRTLLGFGPPLPPPDLSGMPPNEESRSWWWRWLAPRIAWASEPPARAALEQWLATPDRLGEYLPRVHRVLQQSTETALQAGNLAAEYQGVFRSIVLATAWQESCWRQFVQQKGQITYIRSAVGSSGLMQVNERVWRGVYDLRGIRWDIAYNARAGTEISLHYLQDYAIARGEHRQPGGMDNLARATYAVYNGGPGHLARYRNDRTKPALKKIDTLFWQKYQAVRRGETLVEVARCLGGDGAVGSVGSQ